MKLGGGNRLWKPVELYGLAIRKSVKSAKKAAAKDLSCQFCGEIVRADKLSVHEMNHVRGGAVHACNFCGKKFPYKAYLQHVRAHKKLLAFGRPPKKRCHICSGMYADPYTLKMHIKRMHKERERFKCPTCGKTFAEQRFLNRHETLHTKSFPFNCATCGKGYNVKCALEYHEDTVHTKVRRYVCQVTGCNEAFYVNLYLRRHLEKAHPRLAAGT